MDDVCEDLEDGNIPNKSVHQWYSESNWTVFRQAILQVLADIHY